MDKKVIEFNKEMRKDMDFNLQAGDVVKVHLRIKEGEKQRVQKFEGLVLGIKGRQSSSPTLTVRKVSRGVGVEMIIPMLSKNVEKIELIKRAKVRRAKLYYVRELTAKKSRMKYKDMKDFIKEEVVEEEIKEEKKEEQEKVEEKTEIKKEEAKKENKEKKEESK